jgi:tyrosinase
MSDPWASPSDPVFWLHHSFIDHSWATWQNQYSAKGVGLSVDGTDSNNVPITLDTVLSMGGIGPDVPIRSIVNTAGGVSIGGKPFCFKYDY